MTLMDYDAIREADYVLVDKEIYDKFIPVEWEIIEKWRKERNE